MHRIDTPTASPNQNGTGNAAVQCRARSPRHASRPWQRAVSSASTNGATALGMHRGVAVGAK